MMQKFFRKNRMSCGRMAVQLYLLLIMCFPAMLSAQNGVMVSGLDVNAGTVTFKVSWDKNSPDMPPAWSDTVWVFVDYNDAGTMKRLPLMLNAGAALTETSAPGEGRVKEEPGNDQGVWVIGNAKTAPSGSFSATVKLFSATAVATTIGACAYASNYRPTGEYVSSGSVIHFTGAPPYELVLKHDVDGTTKPWRSAADYFVQPEYTLHSFTDKTGAPGVLKCAPMTGNINFECAPSSAPKGQPVTFTVNLEPTAPPTSAVTYSWSAPGFAPAAHSGTSFSTTAPNTPDVYDVTLTARSRGFCDLTRMNGVTVVDCLAPKGFTLIASASSFCEGSAGVTFALSDTENGAKYRLYKNSAPAGTELSGTGSAATFSGTFNEGDYTAQLVAGNTKYCSGMTTGLYSISRNPSPTLELLQSPDVCLNEGSIMFTATGSGAVEWLSDGGGVVSGNTVTFAGTLTGIKTVEARSAQTYTNAPTCYSASVTKSATVNPLPAVVSANGNSRCGDGTVTLSATPSSNAIIDWYDSAIDGAILNNGSATNNFLTPSISTSTTYYAQAHIPATGCVSASRTAVLATVHTAPTAPAGLTADKTTICSGEATPVILTATGGDAGSGAVYEWGTGTVGSNLLSPSTTTANTYSVTVSDAITYWVRLKGTTSCSNATNGVSTSIGTYGAINAGAITTTSTTTWIGVNSKIMVEDYSTASGVSGTFTYLWLRTGTGGASTLTANGAVSYTINSGDYATAGTYYFNRYAKDAACSTAAWIAATGTYTLVVIEGVNQLQGGCTFTPPPVVGTFASFDKDYSASTYVTLTDERDNNNYTVVKIGNRWIMAQNLNYQKDLIWQTNSNKPSTNTGRNTGLIGHFWCPGGYSSTSGTSTQGSCDVWGALYSWETAMMVDGKWTSSAKTSSTWLEPSTYGTNPNLGNPQNHARSDAGATTGGRGICPPNWHVPTDSEWGDVLNAMESGGGTAHNATTGNRGTDAGARGKSKCVVANRNTSGNTYVNDNAANWYYYSSTLGTDVYGFRVLPAGRRNNSGSYFGYRGRNAYFWNSTAYNSSSAGYRYFSYNRANVYRHGDASRSSGFSVRCIRDL
jgi:uncharacterized protein (TIGR02145 family)